MQTATQDKITLVTNDFTGPAIPEQFLRDLRSYDPSLHVEWNCKKMRFVIQQCIKHHAPTSTHNHLCERIYVLLVEDSEHCMMALGSGVMERIRARDVSRAGYGPDDRERWIADRNAEEQKAQEKIKADQRDVVRHCSRDGRRQLLRAFNALSNMGTPNR